MQKQIIGLFWKSALRYPFRTVSAIISAVLIPLISAFAAPFIIAQILEKLQAGTLTLDSAWPLIGLYAATELFGQIIGWRLTLFFSWTMETAAQRDLYKQMFTTLSQQSLAFYSDRFGGALVSQATKIIGAFERFWDTVIFQVIPLITAVTAATIILGIIFWQYALFLLGLSIMFAVIVYFGSRFMTKRNKAEAQASTATNAQVADAITNIMTIKSYGNEAIELDALNEKTSDWSKKSLHVMRGFLGASGAYSAVISLLNITAIITAIWAAEHSIISIGTVYLAITYTLTIARQLWDMNNIMRNYNRIVGDASDMVEILNLTPSVVDKTTKNLHVSRGEISFIDMSFTHKEKTEHLFKNFNLVIQPGERIGLVGHSGSGKSTLTRLLLRFSDVQKGRITIDDQDITDITQESLRKAIAYVPQEPLLFHRSLRDNIAYGKQDATDSEILAAIKQANALEFIEKLPDGLDTMVGERGVKLSGGQRQRIAIARAILKNAPILVLDEATSALDSESEKLIQDALSKLMKGRTSLVIAHRLSTIAKLDRIIVLDNGEIKEQGSHAQLLNQKGNYATLWSHQSGGFIEE